MANYSIEYRYTIPGSTLKGVVKNVTNGKYAGSGGSWYTDIDDVTAISLSEGAAGVYSGTSGVPAPDGAIFENLVYLDSVSDSNFLISSKTKNDANSLTVLEVINNIQEAVSSSQSASLADPRAKLVLNYLNRLLADEIKNTYPFDEFVVYGQINMTTDRTVYPFIPPNCGAVKTIEYLKTEYDSLYNDWVLDSRIGNFAVIRLNAEPSENFILNYKIIEDIPNYTSADGAKKCVLPNICIAGGIWKMKEFKKEDFGTAYMNFKNALSRQVQIRNQASNKFKGLGVW
jgi:hypothetical protein